MVYIVFMITEYEYCGKEIVGVFSTLASAQDYINKKEQSTFQHWSGVKVEIYSIEEWEIED